MESNIVFVSPLDAIYANVGENQQQSQYGQFSLGADEIVGQYEIWRKSGFKELKQLFENVNMTLNYYQYLKGQTKAVLVKNHLILGQKNRSTD